MVFNFSAFWPMRERRFSSQIAALSSIVCALLFTHGALAQNAYFDLSSDAMSDLSDVTVSQNQLSELQTDRVNNPAQPSGDVTGSISRSNQDDGTAPGLRSGNFTIRPSIDSRLVYESERVGDSESDRTYNETNLGLSLQSDWARHSLNIDANGSIQSNLSGSLAESPSASVNALLGLDISSILDIDIGADYDYSIESRTDPNAVSDATGQADVHQFGGSLAINKDVGTLRGSVAGSLTKRNYGDATLSDGTVVSGDDRDILTSSLTLRLQYAGNEVLMPFVEGGYTRGSYDQTIDDSGLERSYSGYFGRIGLVYDKGEKFSSEFGVGYELTDLDDESLTSLSAVSIDSAINWSPRRGTDIVLALSTSQDPSTSSGVSGSVLHAFNSTVTQDISRQLTAIAGFDYGLRRYEGSIAPNDENILSATLGLDWLINRYLKASLDASYTKTTQSGSDDVDNVQLGFGLNLTR